MRQSLTDARRGENCSNMSVDVPDQVLTSAMEDVGIRNVPINTTSINQTELNNEVKRSLKTESKFECSYCDRLFRKERNLILHIREDHDDEDLDDKSVKFDIEVTKPKKNLNECPECGIDYHIESELKRHMDLRHSDPSHLVTSEGDEKNKEETSSDDIERLLAQDEDSSETGIDALIEEIDFLDEIVVNASGADIGDIDSHPDKGVSLPKEDVDQSDKDVVKSQNELKLGQGVLDNEKAVAQDDGNSLDESENLVKEDDAGKTNSKGDDSSRHQADNEFTHGDEEPMEIVGEEMVVDDDSFNLLENAMQVSVSTPDDSDEDDIPLSSRKRKRKPAVEVLKKKKGRSSKKCMAGEEIQLDGEAVIKDLNSSADDDIVVVDERNIVEREDTSSEGSESEDDDPDFTPIKSKKRRSKEIPEKRVKRSNRKVNKPIQITPIVEEKITGKRKKLIAKGKTKGPLVDDDIVVVDEVNIVEREVTSSEESEAEDDDPDFTPNERAKGRRTDALDKHVRRSNRKVQKPIKQSAQVEEKIIARGRTKVSIVPIEAKSVLKAIPKSTQVMLFSSGSNRKNVSQSARNVLKDVVKTKPRTSVQQKQKDVVRCGKCNLNFDSKVQLENHNKRNHYYPCGSCNKVYDMKQRLATHDKAAHQSCDVCEDEFSWPEPGHACYYTKNKIRPVVRV